MLTDDEIDSVASTFSAPGKVQASLSQAVDKQPDTEAKLQQLAKQYSLPVDAVRLNQNEVERRRKLDAVDVQALVADNPAVSNLFADPQKAAIAHDDVDNLTATETVLKYAKMGAYAAAATPFYVGSGVAGKIQEANELLASGADALGIPSGILKDYAGYYSALADQQKGIADTISEPAKGLIDSAVQSGFKSLAQNAAIAVPVAMTGGSAAIPVALMSMLTGGESYHKYRKAGVQPIQSAVHATADEAVEAITELPGMSILFDNLKIGSSWVKSVLASVVPEQIGEQWATVLQDYNEQITLHPEKSVSEFIKERPDAALQTAIATAIGQGGMVAIAESIDAVGNAGQKKVAQADRVANLLSHINDLAQASKVLQRDPQTYEQMLEMATEDGDASHVYIDAKALYQSGVADRLADLSPTVREQLSSSLGTIQIPTSEYGSRVAPTDVAQALVDHIKFDPDGFSRSEAAEFQKQFAEEQQAEIERALGNAQNDQVFADSAKTVGETIKQMLDATGFNANVKDANASFSTLMQNFYAVTAAKIGVSPEELYQQYPLQVTADGKLGVGKRLDQGMLQTDTEEFKNWFGDSKVVDADGKPLVLYHITPEDVSEFKLGGEDILSTPMAGSKAARSASVRGYASGPGIWMSDDKVRGLVAHHSLVSKYGEEKHPNVMPLYARFENPLVITSIQQADELESKYKPHQANLPLPGRRQSEDGRWEIVQSNSLEFPYRFDHFQRQAILNDGYDSIILKLDGRPTEYIALHKNQIKSAIGNNGNFDPNNSNILYQSAEDDRIADEDYRVLRRSYNDLLPDEQEAFDEFIASRSDGKEILDRLKEHVGTPWAKAAMEGIFVRQAIGVYADGGTPKFQSMFDHKNATKPRELVKKFGWDGVLMHVEYTGFVGDAAKPINNVSSTFINCNPSKDCAKYCYATEGHYRYANSVIKSELVSLAVERDPARAAARTAAEYKVTTEFLNNKALRLFDKGDGSAEWLPFIKALNDEGIRVQIFSKVPEFLRQVPDINLRLLSVDESNMETADQNPDLPVAFVYSGAEGQVEFLAKLVERGQIQVVLPVKLGRKVFSNDQTKKLKSAVPGIGKYICPIDGGIKKIGKTHEADKWNCTKCDKNGGLGCFFGKVTEQVMKSAEVKPLSSKEKAARILDLRRQINDLTNGNSTGDTAAAGSAGISEPVVNDGRDGQGHVQNLLREVDGLLGELLRDYEPDAETSNAFQGDGGAAQETGGVQGNKSPTGHRIIPIKSLYQTAWHGSPHSFDRFSTNKIGTGEGAQAFGYGLYFTDAKDIAEWYRDNLSRLKNDNKEVKKWLKDSDNFYLKSILDMAQKEPKKLNELKEKLQHPKWGIPSNDDLLIDISNAYSVLGLRNDAKSKLLRTYFKEYSVPFPSVKGKLYQVELAPEQDEYLDWNKPLSEQSEKVKAALANTTLQDSSNNEIPLKDSYSGEFIYKAISKAEYGDDEASSLLHSLGIRGIRYKAEQGRSDANNYVVFSDDDVEIKEFLQRNSDQHRGSFSPDNLTITLFKSQNLSTFLHESGHFFLHMQMDLAARLQNQEDLKPGEQSLVDDANAIMQWFGLSSINDWYALDFEQQRSYHEKFAEGFETYLFEGKAPSIELQSVFQRFRAWLIGVYKSIKNMTEITQEIRGVMDRMIATSEQIALAERGRSMMPLFTREDAEAVGLTPEWFAEYQNLYINGTQDAIDDMQSKAMRDMAFSRNAHGRMFKKLQKLAEEKRREVRIGVRDEIMSRPVYRAWTFLTTPLGDTDKLPKPKKPKNDPNVVNPAVDSMATAIAKLGGLNKQELIDEWGIDPAYKPKSGVFGKPVLRIEGGLTREAMAEKLVEEGYLSADENGKHDLREFEDKLDEQLRGNDQFSVMFEPDGDAMPGSQAANPGIIAAGRLDHGALLMMNIDDRFVRLLQERKMVASNGLSPDMVAGLLLDEEGNQLFDDGEHLIEALVNADDPKQVIEDETDVRMLEQYGELSSPAAIAKAADAAIYNDVRARMLAHEVNGLAQATGERKLLVPAAKSYAEQIVARTKVRDLTPGKYTSAAERAGKAAKKAHEKGDMPVAVAEKRNQLINELAAKATTNAQEEIKKTLDYLRKFAKAAPGIDADYRDQIDQLLERYDLKPMTNKEADKRTALSAWLASQEKMGIAPDIHAYLTAAAAKESYKNLTVEELRGLRDAVKTIEHLGRLKNRLLTAQRNRDLIAAREEIVASIEEFASGVLHENRTEVTGSGIMAQGMLKFVASHYKVANLARIMDGGKDGGVVWEYFVRSANERSNYESTKRAWATKTLSEIMAPVLADGSFNTSMRVPNFNRRLTKQQIFVMALNTGNEGNLQRLTSGEQLTIDQIMPALKMLSTTDWEAVQKIWDTFELLRPEIAEKQKRVYGVEPTWVENKPFTLDLSSGSQVSLDGGYYPVKYDPRANEKADQQDAVTAAKEALSAAFRAPSTRRGHTKARADEVHNRPLLLSLDALYSSFGTVIHDLAWHEWLIDMNRLMKGSVDTAIRSNYGADAMSQFTEWKADIATGDGKMYDAATRFLGKMRQWVSVAGLGYNVVSAMMQPLGLTNSFVRVGYGWMGEGLRQFIGDIPGSIKHVEEKSEFVRNRFRTRFRELNELRNQVQNQDSPLRPIQENAYWMMLRAQQLVDTPTWLAAYAKATSEGNNDTRAIAMADQAVIDAQGGGELKDLSAIERGSPASKLFTVFYTYMNTVYNLNAQVIRSDRSVAKKAADLLMLDVVPVVLGAALKAALTPSGDDWDWEDLAKSLIAEEIGWIMGLMVGVRELSDAGKVLLTGEGRDYQGPAGARLLVDVTKFSHEASQGEFDTGFRKAAINLLGDVAGLPSAQANRTVTGIQAIAEGKTSNPAALAFGFHK